MRILIFSTAYLPFVGGAELAIKEITDRLSPSEFLFDLITLNLNRRQKPEEQVGNINVIRLSCSKLFFPILAFIRARKLHRQNAYTCVWAVMASYGGFAGLFFKHHFPKVPFILTLQEGDSLSHIYKRVFFVWPLFKMIFTRADRITAISNYLADWARKMGATADVHVIPNGVNVKAFSVERLAYSEEALRKSLGSEREDKIIITTSRLVKKNGVEDIIGSLRYLPKHIKLLICGTGPLEDDLTLTTNRYALNARVKFIGFVSHGELPRYLHASDIFCRPSLSEGMGSSFIEAMAAGVPIIATPVGGIPDFLQDGETGLFCKVNDPKSIAEKVELLLSNGELRERIIANASHMVREKYGWNGIAEKMRGVLTSSVS